MDEFSNGGFEYDSMAEAQRIEIGNAVLAMLNGEEGAVETFEALEFNLGVDIATSIAIGVAIRGGGLRIGPYIPRTAANATRKRVIFSIKQLDKKFKHASDFGVTTTKKNPTILAQYETAIKSHLADPKTVRQGTYGFVKDSKVHFNPTTNNTVVVDKFGNFVTGYKLTPGTPQYTKYIYDGLLR